MNHRSNWKVRVVWSGRKVKSNSKCLSSLNKQTQYIVNFSLARHKINSCKAVYSTASNASVFSFIMCWCGDAFAHYSFVQT